MDATIKTPVIGSTISPPRKTRASAPERGGLSTSEKVTLAGIAGYQGGATWQGAVVAGSSTRGYVSGDLQKVTRNSFSGELGTATPLNLNGTSDDVHAHYVDAITANGTPRLAYKIKDELGERLVAVRTVPDGDDELPTVYAIGDDDDAPTPTKITKAAPVKVDVEDLVPAFLASMGHKGNITPALRTLALDAMAARQQLADYAAR